MLIEEKDLGQNTLMNSVNKLLQNRKILDIMSSNVKKLQTSDSNAKIYKIILSMFK
jgi:UDP-N-acetylglucosamine:LPS N-acetylglucosamine transferase